MDSLMASGDANPAAQPPRLVDDDKGPTEDHGDTTLDVEDHVSPGGTHEANKITPEDIEENENKLKARIEQCKHIIESLKHELNEEKSRRDQEMNSEQAAAESSYESDLKDLAVSDNCRHLLTYTSSMYAESVDNKLKCDESLIEYEKQLQKYQNTLSMAQMEKKNAIRKQMLSKAYKLKLLEIENQCNIELLRVKQNLQCLEPLQMITSKWKTGNNQDSYDLNNYELLPRFPEVSALSGSDPMTELMKIANAVEDKQRPLDSQLTLMGEDSSN